MSCYFCDGPRVAPVRNVSHYQLVSHPIGTMSLERRFDGQPMIKIEMDVDVTFDVCIGDADVHTTVLGQIEDIKYCPFCGRKIVND